MVAGRVEDRLLVRRLGVVGEGDLNLTPPRAGTADSESRAVLRATAGGAALAAHRRRLGRRFSMPEVALGVDEVPPWDIRCWSRRR